MIDAKELARLNTHDRKCVLEFQGMLQQLAIAKTSSERAAVLLAEDRRLQSLGRQKKKVRLICDGESLET